VKNSFIDYREFTVQQFLEDPFFQDWVLRPDVGSDQFWFNWISQNPDKSEILDEAKNILLELKIPEYALTNEEIEGIWENVLQKSKSDIELKVILTRNRISWKKILVSGIAAVFVLGFLFTWIQPEKVELKTAFSETRFFTLPDGSKVILNANSRLTFFENWGSASPREIWLEGEAFFEVMHLESHQPFLVYTGNGVEVEVLGTSFSVYDRNKKSQIVLEEGNVSLSLAKSNQPREKILMKPGELVSIKENKVEKRKVKAENYTSWTKNILILDQTSLEEIIRVGRENFGFEIQIDPKVSISQTASGSMPLEDPEQFMNLTSKIFNISIEKKETKYLITP